MKKGRKRSVSLKKNGSLIIWKYGGSSVKPQKQVGVGCEIGGGKAKRINRSPRITLKNAE